MFKNKNLQKTAVVLSAPLALATQAYAALPEAAKTAIEGAKTDGLEAGWLVVGVVAALFVISTVKRMIK